MSLSIEQLGVLLQVPQQIVILPHTKPDGDAIGSALGLYHCLHSHYQHHDIQIITPTDYPDFLHFLPADEKVIIYPRNENTAKNCIEKATLVFILDCNDTARLDDLQPFVDAIYCPIVLIDHHLDPQIVAAYQVWTTAVSSTAELVYRFCHQLFTQPIINADAALCLYTGIATDTGRFKYNTFPSTFEVVARLIECGLHLEQANNLIFDNNTEKRLRFLGFILSEKMIILPNKKVAYIAVSQEDMDLCQYESGDLEGVVNYPLSIAGIQVVGLFKEQSNDDVGLSFRSKGDFSVNLYVREHFIGGGHKNAAGGRSSMSLDDTIHHFLDTIANYPELQGSN